MLGDVSFSHDYDEQGTNVSSEEFAKEEAPVLCLL